MSGLRRQRPTTRTPVARFLPGASIGRFGQVPRAGNPKRPSAGRERGLRTRKHPGGRGLRDRRRDPLRQGASGFQTSSTRRPTPQAYDSRQARCAPAERKPEDRLLVSFAAATHRSTISSALRLLERDRHRHGRVVDGERTRPRRRTRLRAEVDDLIGLIVVNEVAARGEVRRPSHAPVGADSSRRDEPVSEKLAASERLAGAEPAALTWPAATNRRRT